MHISCTTAPTTAQVAIRVHAPGSGVCPMLPGHTASLRSWVQQSRKGCSSDVWAGMDIARVPTITWQAPDPSTCPCLDHPNRYALPPHLQALRNFSVIRQLHNRAWPPGRQAQAEATLATSHRSFGYLQAGCRQPGFQCRDLNRLLPPGPTRQASS
jgi:hypothetical protein